MNKQAYTNITFFAFNISTTPVTWSLRDRNQQAALNDQVCTYIEQFQLKLVFQNSKRQQAAIKDKIYLHTCHILYLAVQNFFTKLKLK